MQPKYLSLLLSLAAPLAVSAPAATPQGGLFDCACGAMYDICIGDNNGDTAAQLQCGVQFILCTIPCNIPLPSGLALPTSLLNGLPLPTPVPTGVPAGVPLTVPTGVPTGLPIPLPNPL